VLAFVFWNWPRPDVRRDEYESRLVAFHERLAGALPGGMERSLVWRVSGAPWLPSGSGYEDWYLLENSAALDVINRDAVTGILGEQHHAAARLSGGGTSGLYQPAETAAGVATGALAIWFSKPEGMGYGELFSNVDAEPGRLWSRMLVLGPTPEFCLLEPAERTLPEKYRPTLVERAPLWP
jgi:hypothetical protein